MRDRPLVLLLDDEEIFLEIATIKLHMSGFGVAVAHTVAEALARAEELLPDLILSDIYMPPGPSGWEFAFTVHDDPKLKNIKFAFFTSLYDPMRDLSESARARVMKDLDHIVFFSKLDVVKLGEGVHDLINNK